MLQNRKKTYSNEEQEQKHQLQIIATPQIPHKPDYKVLDKINCNPNLFLSACKTYTYTSVKQIQGLRLKHNVKPYRKP